MKTAFKYLGQVIGAILAALAFFVPHILVAGDKPLGLRAAVAANFLIPMEEIASLYRKETGIAIEVSAGSTGKLYAQIRHGAPFDLFLAADTERPRLLFNQGIAGQPVAYAVGEVRLWSTRKMKGTDWRECLGSMTDKKIAIAVPDIAPYGKAARDGLRRAA
ncbi:MAG: molybdate ABC transporter substrate-binding protein, partial [Desulfobulbaceae bacterium]|nr:molybdate ABC transporter substrate-binding protein [Desulfobulbaceae bacterium]